MKDELQVIRDKYSDDRRTEIQPVSGEVDIEDLIPVTDCVVTLTHFATSSGSLWMFTTPSAGADGAFPV